MHCNVMNYNEILFFDFHRSSYAETLPGIQLSQVAINIFWVGSIIRVQFSGWKLFGGTYLQSIILWGNSLSTICPRANYLGDNFWGRNFRGAIVRVAIIWGTIVWGTIIQGAIVQRTIIRRAIVLFSSNIFSIVISTNIPGDQSFGGSSSNIKLYAQKSKLVQTNEQFNVQISLVFSWTSFYSTRTKTQQIHKNIIMQPM